MPLNDFDDVNDADDCAGDKILRLGLPLSGRIVVESVDLPRGVDGDGSNRMAVAPCAILDVFARIQNRPRPRLPDRKRAQWGNWWSLHALDLKFG
jgi:hypothetical protein